LYSPQFSLIPNIKKIKKSKSNFDGNENGLTRIFSTYHKRKEKGSEPTLIRSFTQKKGKGKWNKNQLLIERTSNYNLVLIISLAQVIKGKRKQEPALDRENK
jgi:hypothetical protein